MELQQQVSIDANSPPPGFAWDNPCFSRCDDGEQRDRAVAALRIALAKEGHVHVDAVKYAHRLRELDGKNYYVTFAKPAGGAGRPHVAVLPLAEAAKRLAYEGDFDRGQINDLESMLAAQRAHRAVLQEQERTMHARIEKQRRLEAWFDRSRIDRALTRLAAARPKDAELLLAMADAIEAEPEAPRWKDGDIVDELPPDDIDLKTKKRK